MSGGIWYVSIIINNYINYIVYNYIKLLRLFIGLINIDLHISVPPKIPLWAAAVGVKFFDWILSLSIIASLVCQSLSNVYFLETNKPRLRENNNMMYILQMREALQWLFGPSRMKKMTFSYAFPHCIFFPMHSYTKARA